MKSWYKLAQSKPRQYQFDNEDNVYYKILEKEEPFQEDDTIRVYHAFRDLNDAIMSAKHGLSGQDKADRVYSYEANNNPSGLFITTNFESAKQFTTFGAIMEFTCKYSELEIPVWPGGGYTVQGEMSQYWDWDKLNDQRANATLIQREQAKESEYPAIANSSRPELAEMLMSPREYQALFTGHLNPNRINSFWLQDQQGTQLLMSDPWIQLTKDEFIEQYQYSLQKDLSGRERMSDKHMGIEGKMFAPEDEFDPTTLIQNISNNYSYSPEQLMEIIKELNFEQAQEIMSNYVWPKQTQDLQNWLQIIFQ